jgi:para-nitrobenzyl esterase
MSIKSLPDRRTGLKAIRLIAAFLMGLAPASGAALAQGTAASDLVVRTEAGLVRGARDGDVVWFKGVPFAQPPVGDLRWQAPKPVKAWSGVRPADQFGDDCISLPEVGMYSPSRARQSEDCLYLNIWKPAKVQGRLPVMVWIYGGGFSHGGSSPAIYDGSALARQGVMLVSINYRVGQLGFFAHPALAKEQAGQPRGNYGFLDQIAAMTWIRKNIAAFGGDPRNVTVFGESAGGFSVHMLLTSPLAQGLIDKAIIESGGGRRTIMNGQRMSEEGPDHHVSAEAKGLAWAQSKGINGDGPEALARLRALPVSQVLDNLAFGGPYYAGPMIDGTIVPYNMMTAYDSGRYAHIPLIIGANSGDMNLNQVKTKDALFARFGDQAERARAVYDPDGQADVQTVLGEEGADEMMHETARFTARRFTEGHVPAYVYRFGYIPAVDRPGAQPKPPGNGLPPQDNLRFGGVPGAAYHGYEIWMVFDTVAARYGANLTPQDQTVAKMMSGYWTAFARTGDPNGEGRPVWAPYDLKTDPLLVVAPDGHAATVPDPWKARLDMAETLNLKTRE